MLLWPGDPINLIWKLKYNYIQSGYNYALDLLLVIIW